MKTFDSILKEKETPNFWQRFKKWHNKNKYTIRKIIFFPLYIYILISDKIKENHYNKRREYEKTLAFSKEEAKRIVDKYIGTWSYFDEETNSFEISTYYWNWLNRYPNAVKNKKDKGFIHRFCDELIEYVHNEYEIDGYKKEKWNEESWQHEDRFVSFTKIK